MDKALATAEEVSAHSLLAEPCYFLASYQMEKGKRKPPCNPPMNFLRMEPKNPLAYWTLGTWCCWKRSAERSCDGLPGVCWN